MKLCLMDTFPCLPHKLSPSNCTCTFTDCESETQFQEKQKLIPAGQRTAQSHSGLAAPLLRTLCENTWEYLLARGSQWAQEVSAFVFGVPGKHTTQTSMNIHLGYALPHMCLYKVTDNSGNQAVT